MKKNKNSKISYSDSFVIGALNASNYESQDMMVSHPSHYQSKTGLEVIDVIEAFTNELRGIEATDTGNVLKYICRWHAKNGLQDLEKAQWYLTHLINHLRKEEVCTAANIVFHNPILDSRCEAEDVLSRMDEIIHTYGFVTMADFYDLVGFTKSKNEPDLSKCGWNNIDVAKVVRRGSGYVIKMPRPIYI